jgi:DNA-binding Lrp family transcriptional regulator
MVTAFALLNVVRNRITAVADTLSDLSEVSEVYSVSGRFDLVAIIRVSDVDELAKVVTEKLLVVDGITHSETLLAFRTYSRHDLERLFSIGSDGL